LWSYSLRRDVIIALLYNPLTEGHNGLSQWGAEPTLLNGASIEVLYLNLLAQFGVPMQ